MNITFNIKKLRIFLPLTVALYVFLLLSFITYDGNERSALIYCAVFPIIIFIMGVYEFNISARLKNIVGLLLLLCTPDCIITKILNNGDIYYLQSRLINTGLILTAMLIMLVIFLRSDVAVMLPSVLCFLLFIANELVTAFRGTPVSPADLWATKTALSVSGEYRFFISPDMLSSLNFLILLAVLSRIFCVDLKKHYIVYRVVFAAVGAVLCVLIANSERLMDKDIMKYDGFALSASNKDFGSIATLYMNIKQMFIAKPEGYSDEQAEMLLEQTGGTEGDDVLPNVVVIMNEAFSDYGDMMNVQPSEDPLPYWHSLTENAIDGTLLVPVTGGGTSYTEYEFLSGLGGGIFRGQYNHFLRGIHDDTYSIAWDFKELGYKNIAIHPFWASCWNRELVYPRIGFDDFISGEDFDSKTAVENDTGYILKSTDLGDIDYVRNYASDKESYNKVIEQFKNKSEGEKLFVFNVTVQNHGGYDYEGDNFEYKITSQNYPDNRGLNQYLSLLKYSDEAYQELIEFFMDYPEPTVVLMFGDHQPSFIQYEPTEKYSKYGDNYLYVTNYKLWTNYSLPETVTGGDVGAGFLSLKLKQAAGMPFNEWDSFRSELNEHFLGISLYGYAREKNDTVIYGGEITEEEEELYSEYKILEYYLFFRQGLLEN